MIYYYDIFHCFIQAILNPTKLYSYIGNYNYVIVVRINMSMRTSTKILEK